MHLEMPKEDNLTTKNKSAECMYVFPKSVLYSEVLLYNTGGITLTKNPVLNKSSSPSCLYYAIFQLKCNRIPYRMCLVQMYRLTAAGVSDIRRQDKQEGNTPHSTACRIQYSMQNTVQHAEYSTACRIQYSMQNTVQHVEYSTACRIQYIGGTVVPAVCVHTTWPPVIHAYCEQTDNYLTILPVPDATSSSFVEGEGSIMATNSLFHSLWRPNDIRSFIRS